MGKCHYRQDDAAVIKPSAVLTAYEYGQIIDGKTSFAVVDIDGTHGPVRMNGIDEVLYIIEGRLTISQDGQDYDVCQGDLFHLKAGAWRTEKGKARVLAVCTPPFDPAREEV